MIVCLLIYYLPINLTVILPLISLFVLYWYIQCTKWVLLLSCVKSQMKGGTERERGRQIEREKRERERQRENLTHRVQLTTQLRWGRGLKRK